jgi:hypothetical protein
MALTFVNPTETRRIDLSDGDWIEVRDRITFGAKERLGSISIRTMTQSEGDGPTKFDLDMSTYKIERMAAYIVGWSARKPDGSPAKPDKSAFGALSEAAADEINEALDRHIEARAEEAKRADGNPTQPAIDGSSYLVDGSVGVGESY